MALKTREKTAAKRRLEMAQSIPSNSIPLAGHLFMSSIDEALELARNPNASLLDRKLAALVLEITEAGDWPAMSCLVDQAIEKSA